jgi:hypothetical protein
MLSITQIVCNLMMGWYCRMNYRGCEKNYLWPHLRTYPETCVEGQEDYRKLELLSQLGFKLGTSQIQVGSITTSANLLSNWFVIFVYTYLETHTCWELGSSNVYLWLFVIWLKYRIFLVVNTHPKHFRHSFSLHLIYLSYLPNVYRSCSCFTNLDLFFFV